MRRLHGYSSLDAAYHDGLNAAMNGEPDNLWSPYATEEEAAFWRYGWRDGQNLLAAERAWADETKRVSAAYAYLDERRRRC